MTLSKITGAIPYLHLLLLKLITNIQYDLELHSVCQLVPIVCNWIFTQRFIDSINTFQWDFVYGTFMYLAKATKQSQNSDFQVRDRCKTSV